MKSLYRVISSLGISALFCVGALAQSSGGATKQFAKDGLSFEYPAEWSIADESTPEALQLTLTRKGSSVQVMIIAKRGITLRKDLPAAHRDIAEPLVKKISTMVGKAGRPAKPTEIRIKVGAIEAEGVRLHSPANKRPSTGEVLWLRSRLRFLSLAFVRSDAHESEGSQLWQTILTSLKVDAPVTGVLTLVAPSGTPKVESGAIGGGVLNGRALQLPRPAYPPIARQAHASGTVVVQVTIDEQGNVISAHAVSGHPLLLAVSVAAARQSKFSPTLLEDEPVKVTGVITYNFVAQ
jgi:TonB family protein